MSVAAGVDQPASLSRAEQQGTVVIYSPYINKLKTIQEVRTVSQDVGQHAHSFLGHILFVDRKWEMSGDFLMPELRDAGNDSHTVSLHLSSTCRAGASRRACVLRIPLLGRYSR